MTKFNISYERNGVCQTILINAESEEIAKAYFMERKPDATVYGVHEATSSDERPGKPVIDVPADYVIAAATKEAEEAEEEKEGKNTMTNGIKTREEITNAIVAYFEENEDVFNACIEELDSYNGYLGDDRYFEMEMLDEFYCSEKATEILYRAFYGHDEDNYHTDANGNREHAEFNPNRNYFKFNAYGNLVSTNYPDYSHLLDRYFVEALADDRRYLYSVDDDETLKKLFDQLEKIDESDEEKICVIYETVYTIEELREEYENLTGCDNVDEFTDGELVTYMLEAYKESSEE